MQTKREEGFSLLDLMIGAIVGVILIGAVLSVIVHQGQLRRANTETSLAMGACMNTLERLRVLDAATLLAMDGKGFDVQGSNGNAGGLHPVPGDLDGLPDILTIVVDGKSGGTVLYLVVATVRWTGVIGKRSYSLQTLIGERK